VSHEANEEMPLHRDIFWVGKQWSVTGLGMQAIDQKLKGKFDIEISRLWDDDLLDALRDEKWFNDKDFEKGLLEARKRYLRPAGKAASKTAPVLVAPPATRAKKEEPDARPAPVPAHLAMRIEGCRAKFLPTWRVRMR
jgi:hypothetical protein